MISATALGEAIEMARRSKMKRSRLYWLRRMETLSKLRVSSESLEEAFEQMPKDFKGTASSWAPHSRVAHRVARGVLLSRNVSVPYLLRQFGGAKADPPQKNRRIPGIDNVQREAFQVLIGIYV